MLSSSVGTAITRTHPRYLSTQLPFAAEPSVVHTVGTPIDLMFRMMHHVSHMTAIRLFPKWKAFDRIPMDDDCTAISYADLAARLGAQEALIGEEPEAALEYH